MVPIAPSTVIALNTTSGTAGATLTSSIFDMLGYHFAQIFVDNSVAGATTPPTVVALQTNDSNSTTGMATDTAFGSGNTAVSLPNTPTSAGTAPYQAWLADWRNRKRYGQVVIGNLGSTSSWAVRVLRYRADRAPVSITDLNVLGVQEG